MKDGRLIWDEDGRDWPQRALSRFVDAGGVRWHVQIGGTGPIVLLIHGTGSASHSWRHLVPLLMSRYTVVVPDLPGHAFSGPPADRRFGLDDMARGLAALLQGLSLAPTVIAGNSAGAAIAARLCLDGAVAPARLLSFNGALLPLDGVSGALFPPLAKIAAVTPLVPLMFARSAADRRAVERMVAGTGSTLDATGVDLYQRLLRSPRHVESVVRMMAHWRLERLAADLPRLRLEVVLIAGCEDRIVPPSTVEAVKRRVPGAQIEYVAARGHLLHEEDAAAAARHFP